ncbi:MAG: MFS transporter [Candidatus Doudnabacteria bacterium]|nr:MFS transporter [Candidatus Doudnabacteria bacterium]
MYKSSDYIAVLKNFNFAKLWVSQITSQLTNYILSFAILIKVFEMTDSTLSVSLIVVAFGIATLFFGSLAGVYADRFDRRWLLTTVNLCQAGSIAMYFLVGGDFWGLFMITFLYSSLNQFYIPAEAPSIPKLVAKEHILIANSYFAFTNSAALIIGFAAAGALSTSFGQGAPFIIGTLLLIIAGLSTATLPALKPEVQSKNPYSLAKVWHEFKEGIDHFWENKALHYPLMSLVCIQVINGMIITIAPAFMKEAIGVDFNTGPLYLILPVGLGILLGALTLGYEQRFASKRDLIFAGFFGMGLSLFALSFIEYFPKPYLYYAVTGFVLGFFNAHIFAPSHSILQTNAGTALRGRIYGSLYVLLQIAATLPTVAIGVLADRISLGTIMAILGCLLVVFGLFTRPHGKLA